MEFFETVQRRRSIRKFTSKIVEDSIVQKALETAILAPNSSNMQTWDFYWVKSPEKKQRLVQYCLNQSAARTASHLVVVTANPKLWRRTNPRLIQLVREVQAPKIVHLYYEKLIPLVYRWGIFNILAPIKWITTTVVGWRQPISRGPYTLSQLQEVCIKSAALAAENFVLAISAQGYATCMMEGFDEVRVRKMLRLPRSGRVVMVIAVGEEGERGTWGPQWRIPLDEVVHTI